MPYDVESLGRCPVCQQDITHAMSITVISCSSCGRDVHLWCLTFDNANHSKVVFVCQACTAEWKEGI